MRRMHPENLVPGMRQEPGIILGRFGTYPYNWTNVRWHVNESGMCCRGGFQIRPAYKTYIKENREEILKKLHQLVRQKGSRRKLTKGAKNIKLITAK
jgi:hypothetical protein